MIKKSISFVIVLAMLLTVIPALPIYAAAGTAEVLKQSDAKQNFCGDDNAPIAMDATSIIGTQFAIAGDAKYVGIGCPSWSDNSGSLTLSLYKFDKDYDTTVQGTPIIKHEFVDYEDNGYLGFRFTESDPLKAGEYVIVVSDAVASSSADVGVWSQQVYKGQRVYENEEYNEGISLRMFVDLITPLDVPYGTLTANPDNGNTTPVDKVPYLDALMRFNAEDAESYYDASGTNQIDNIEITAEGYLSVDVAAGNDPNFTLKLPEGVDGPTRDDYPIMLIRLKRSEGAPKKGEIFFNTTEFPGPTGGGSVVASYADTTDWQNAIFNLKANSKFTGTLINMRYDIVDAASEPCNFLIDYILFFSSMEAAQEFKHEDLEAMLANKPTPAPATPTAEVTKAPATPTKAPTPSAKATATPEKNDNGLSTAEIAIIAVCAVVVIGGIIIIIVVMNKKKHNHHDDDPGNGSAASADDTPPEADKPQETSEETADAVQENGDQSGDDQNQE